MDNFRNMWDFPVKEGVRFPKANRIHPLMQTRVDELIRLLHQDENIRKLVLFGRSLEFRCNSCSDIDLYMEKQGACSHFGAVIILQKTRKCYE